MLVCILSIFLLNYFDRNYLVLCIALTAVSVVMDALWLLLLGPSHWNPPRVGEFSVGEWGYLRIIFFFTIMQVLAKVASLSNLGWNHHIALTPTQPTRELGIRNRHAQIDNLR